MNNPVKILGDKNTNTNLRYKTGRALKFESGDVFEIKNPADAYLPRVNVSSSFVFCRKDDFWPEVVRFAEKVAAHPLAALSASKRLLNAVEDTDLRTGCLLELNGSKITDNLWLKAGDEVVLEVEGLGRLVNTVTHAPERLADVPASLVGGTLPDLYAGTPSGEAGD